ncbi:hypothetical protein Ais01nite_70580 [Asanoa ishikariensis]|uniref:Uncharacterized protein n=1 Tax=Asanoa ishikariensis TaxID=137265 RepID=A0A1H3UN15_9ACTN|nr:DUF5682 family protein [Asanoa ishikariensis]GIF69023.1 hypothetical protein Ais01nite_70580 [Asanoa ishikariensis]SDZ63778.1 hypothetical protein SAMN05421684_7592 [Asanoa ishikariensis]
MAAPVTVVGVRHHSPACAGLVAATIETLRPAYVLIEGPADVNDRMDELLLGHTLPVAIFTSYRDGERTHASWSPFCGYSPEWVAVTQGRASGAEVRFIDLPAWHPAFATRENRYADAEERYLRATERLCAAFGMDNADTLWDHLVEAAPAEGLADRLSVYFETLRGDSAAGAADLEREAYMATWIRAAAARDEGPVLVVCGGFHRPALERLLATDDSAAARPAMLAPPPGAVGSVPEVPAAPRGCHRPALKPPVEACERNAATPEVPAPPPKAVGSAAEVPAAPGGAAWSVSEVPAAQGGAVGSVPEVSTPPGGAVWSWPAVPAPPPGAVGSSYLVPYAFKRLDAFHGYQSGMPSPEFYQRVWDDGPEAAGRGLAETVVTRLRRRGQPASTADLIAARTMAEGLARVRGHAYPARADVLDGLVSALVGEAMEAPLPWAHRGRLAVGTHPVVVEMVAALAGDRVGALHPDTPQPPLVGAVTAELTRLGLDVAGARTLDLTDGADRERSRALHRLRVLGVPGYQRISGPKPGVDPALTEQWRLADDPNRLVALIEAGGHGATLADAAAAALLERAADAGGRADVVADVLFDAALCGVAAVTGEIVASLRRAVGGITDLAQLGGVLAVALGLWRHDRLFGAARSEQLGEVIHGGVTRGLWLAEGVHGGPAPADLARLRAVVAIRDGLRHAAEALDIDRAAGLAVMARIAADAAAPPDLRGAAFGFGWSLGGGGDPARAVRGAAAPGVLGDWLAGLFSVARDEATADGGLLDVLDGLVGAMTDGDFLIALPALRQAFAYFPPRERQRLAEAVLARRGIVEDGRALLRLRADPVRRARAIELDSYVDELLRTERLVAP